MQDDRTTTLCPYCLRRLEGTFDHREDEVWLRRVCPEHGEVEALVWRGAPGFEAWREAGSGSSCCEPAENPACPTECGLCAGHVRQSCCVLLELTRRCDLSCPVCFAAAGDGAASGAGAAHHPQAPADPSVEVIEGWYRRLLDVAPGCNVQLSGGEPTVRDDLPEIIALGRALGHGFLQLNTNGLRLAKEHGYAERLAEAGLSTVFLQFDGVDDAPYLALRGRPLAAIKDSAARRCATAGLGVVLVPTVVRGVNLDRLGAVLDYALAHAPWVRGVHVQPMALLGRHTTAGDAGKDRVTLPDAMRALAEQSAGRVLLEDLTPGDCEHALCSFSREYLRREDGTLAPMGAPRDACGCGAPGTRPAVVAPADKAAHVAARWSAARPLPAGGCCGGSGPLEREPDQWDDIIRDIRTNTFSVSGMAFQDAWTIDLDRLRHCYLHVFTEDDRVVPFCSRYLTPADHGRLPREERSGGGPFEAVEADRADGSLGSGCACGCGGQLVPGRHRSGCMVCGAALTYHAECELTCHYCGTVVVSAASCDAGHFVCDSCHAAAAVEVVERVCVNSRETDAVALLRRIRAHPEFSVHGPEHHSLVPAVILAALRNRGVPVSDAQIVAAIERGRGVPGGACGLLGVCGAATGVGIALSVLLEAGPLDGGRRQAVQQASAQALAAIAALEAPRCCQRDAWLALHEAAELLPRAAGVSLGAVMAYACDQMAANAECVRAACPLWPANVGAAGGAA